MATRKSCRHCGHHWFWHLKDGRHKCRQCGLRQNFRTVWDSFRLPEASKRRLLEYFVLGVPANRLRFRGPVSFEATSRFYLAIRQALALVEQCSDPFLLETAEISTIINNELDEKKRRTTSPLVVFELSPVENRIVALPLDERRKAEIVSEILSERLQGHLLYANDGKVYASLAVRGKRIRVSALQEKSKSTEEFEQIEKFWLFAKNWLYNRRTIPAKFFHFFLAETLYRFNRTDEDLYPLIYKALRDTDILQIQSDEVQIDQLREDGLPNNFGPNNFSES